MNYKNYNDYELIYMVREKDDYSKGVLYEKYLPIVKSIAKEFYLNYKQYGFEYEDFLQEALLAFENALLKFDENKDNLLYTFIIVCIRRSLITFCRNISCEAKNISFNKLIDIDKCEVLDNVLVEDVVIEQEVQDIIKNFIYSLDFEYGIIFELKFNGFTYREISSLLGLAPSSINYKLKRTRNLIKQQIDNYYCK